MTDIFLCITSIKNSHTHTHTHFPVRGYKLCVYAMNNYTTLSVAFGLYGGKPRKWIETEKISVTLPLGETVRFLYRYIEQLAKKRGAPFVDLTNTKEEFDVVLKAIHTNKFLPVASDLDRPLRDMFLTDGDEIRVFNGLTD